MSGWIGVDLDGTLAHYDGWKGIDHIGDPIEPMVARVKRWITEGHETHGVVEVRIMTARVCSVNDRIAVVAAIGCWCLTHLGVVLPVTNEKDHEMLELWDDRCVQVEANTGRRMDGQPDPVGPA